MNPRAISPGIYVFVVLFEATEIVTSLQKVYAIDIDKKRVKFLGNSKLTNYGD